MSDINEIAQLRKQVETESVEEGEEGQQPQFEEGFTSKTIAGALFVGFIMLPGALYLGLVAGQGLGPAAEWVTIVLFAEIMRRSFLPMKRQEIYILYYLAASLTGLDITKGISGGPFGAMIWNQYFIQSPQAGLVAKQIPHWVVPPAGSPALIHRTFFDAAWFAPILLMLVNEVLGRLNNLSAGYFLFRITSDVERLPFPMAPVAASGATALAEAASKEESWRWRIFSIGTVMGLVFGFFYIAIPVFTSVVFNKPFQLFPIPFFDMATNTETILPGAMTGISGDLGKLMTGFVIPYPIVAGSFWGALLTRVIAAPFLFRGGMFGDAASNGWQRGMDSFYTKEITDMKFWLSVSIGLQIGVALIGFAMVVKAFNTMRRESQGRGMELRAPRGRGDLPIWIPAAIWLVVTLLYMVVCESLLHLDSRPGENHAIFPIWLLAFYGLVWSPINSYVSARMVGLTGSGVSFPYLKEVSIVKSGYPYVDIWYAPIPLNDYGALAQKFREVELTGTKFGSVIKVELVMFPIIMVGSFLFWAFFWHTSQIPSSQHPYASKVWPIQATFQAMFNTINRKHGGVAWVKDSINYPRIGFGILGGLSLYGLFALLHIPALSYYGFIGGAVGAWPQDVLTMYIGAVLGKRYFEKRFGVENWRMYTPVLLAGFSCGTGLMAMAAIALALIAKSVNYLPF